MLETHVPSQSLEAFKPFESLICSSYTPPPQTLNPNPPKILKHEVASLVIYEREIRQKGGRF